MGKTLKTHLIIPSAASRRFRFALPCCALLPVLLLFLASCGQSGSDSHPDLPIGSLDTPRNGTPVSGPVQVAGWAFSNDGIREVAIYVDNHYVQGAKTDVARPDVPAVFPNITSPPGWSFILDTASLKPGSHAVVAQAHSRDGATRDLGTVNIIKQ